MRTSIRGQKLSNVRSLSPTLMDRSIPMLHTPSPLIHLRFAGAKTPRATRGHRGALGHRVDESDPTSLQPVLPVPLAKVSPKSAQNLCDRVGVVGGAGGAFGDELARGLEASVGARGDGGHVECLVVVDRCGAVCLHGVRCVSRELGRVLDGSFYGVVVVC